MFVIEDETHAEHQGEFPTFQAAVEELKRRAGIPWDQKPNCAPCTSWATCGREYAIIEYDSDHREVERIGVLEVSASGVKWMIDVT